MVIELEHRNLWVRLLFVNITWRHGAIQILSGTRSCESGTRQACFALVISYTNTCAWTVDTYHTLRRLYKYVVLYTSPRISEMLS